MKTICRISRARSAALALIVSVALVGDANMSSTLDPDSDITSSVRVASIAKPIPKGGGSYRLGDPYVIAGRTYVPRDEPNYRSEGTASWYGGEFHGRLTANGEIFDANALTAAHPTLPLPSYVRVTNLENNLSMIVRLNDRGPFHNDRLIDLSVRAAKLLGFYERGLAQVRVEYLGPAEIEGSDDKKLVSSLRRVHPAEAQIERPAASEVPQKFALDRTKVLLQPVADISGIAAGSDLPSSISQDARKPFDDLFPKEIFD
jgi:rare lipoprotein A